MGVARSSFYAASIGKPADAVIVAEIPSELHRDLLADHGFFGSMSRRGNPYDNAQAESFMKTLTYAEVHANDYETLEEARTSIGHVLEEVYNHKRLHAARGYRPPVEFEQLLGHVPSPEHPISLGLWNPKADGRRLLHWGHVPPVEHDRRKTR